jgi:hypothetical protein
MGASTQTMLGATIALIVYFYFGATSSLYSKKKRKNSIYKENWPKIIQHDAMMSTHASILVDSVGPPSAEVCRTAASFP